ncbi:hypothetical protein [Microvirga massiliensis]|uniref:hypothetical protein n=1 Tax=Microvirga massiliensis TaxID=1033741 RepID=UPI00062B436A|nr:hypothetical protein [Microvirga massiliensis]
MSKRTTLSDSALLKHLDALGHLGYTIGNDDWFAALDFHAEGDRLAYHVVVDCQSAGFTDTMESGVIPLANWQALVNLPFTWAETANENGGIRSEVDLNSTAAAWERELRKAATARRDDLLRHGGSAEQIAALDLTLGDVDTDLAVQACRALIYPDSVDSSRDHLQQVIDLARRALRLPV